MSTIIYNKKSHFPSSIQERYRVNKSGSSKETYHITLDLKDSNFQFEAGASIAIQPKNSPLLVDEYLKALKATGEEEIFESRSSQTMSLIEFLSVYANLAKLTTGFLKNCEELKPLLKEENRDLLQVYIQTHEPLDFFRVHPPKESLTEICANFLPLLPRFYSIASSYHTHPDKVDLLVAHFNYMHGHEKRYGVGSHFLCETASLHNTIIPTFIQPAHHFKLPSDPTTPIIMVGPGTGIAPYRAFLQEREHFNATGKSWLFFGERNASCDFFYEEFLTSLAAKKRLKLDLAFSRDQEQKYYVQHKLMENKKDLWAWLQEGAHFYVCGDAQRMAKDVACTIEQIIREEGNLSPTDAKAYLKSLRMAKRYLIDVY